MDRIIEIGKELIELQEGIENIVLNRDMSIKAGLYTRLRKIKELTEERHNLLFLVNLKEI